MMKRTISLVALIALMVICFSMGAVVHAGAQEVTLSAGDSLSDALAQVADGGTIVIDGTVSVTTALGTHGKHVTVTGDELDFTGLTGDINLGDHINFDNITLNFTDNAAVFACGYKVKIGEGVTMPNPIRIFAGKRGAAVDSTDLTVLGGQYYQIFGGGNNGDVIGDTHLYVGGNVNPQADPFNHSATYCIYGGGYIHEGKTATIGGTAYTVFTGNAQANYLFGANGGPGTGEIKGGTDVTVSGGQVMSVYGGSCYGSYTGNTKVLVSGGTMEQVFGGCEKVPMTGDVKVDITGGTIKRRVYGGCYNETSGTSFSTSHYVTGQIVLTLHSGANIDYSYDGSDLAVYAHSRQKTLSATEVSHLVYADSTAYSKYKDNVKAQDFAMQLIMGSTSAADHIHYHTYTASGAVITQNCIDSSCAATATLVVEGTPSYIDKPVEPAKVIYSGSWFGNELEIDYANNTGVGTGTASITCGGVTASVDFAISAADMVMNGMAFASLRDAIAAAKQTPGTDTITLLQDIEVSTWTVINTDLTITADKAVTITATDDQTGGMFRITDSTFTVEGASEDAKITLAAGKSTTHIISNNGGNVMLTNVVLAGNEDSTHTGNNKTHGIFNDEGTVTAKSVDITNIGNGDSIYVMDGTTVNLDNVTILGSGRYGIKVKGTLNITNSVHSDHALSVSGSTDHAIDVENGGSVVCDFDNVAEDSYVINLFENMRKGLNVRRGGNAELSNVNEAN